MSPHQVGPWSISIRFVAIKIWAKNYHAQSEPFFFSFHNQQITLPKIHQSKSTLLQKLILLVHWKRCKLAQFTVWIIIFFVVKRVTSKINVNIFFLSVDIWKQKWNRMWHKRAVWQRRIQGKVMMLKTKKKLFLFCFYSFWVLNSTYIWFKNFLFLHNFWLTKTFNIFFFFFCITYNTCKKIWRTRKRNVK